MMNGGYARPELYLQPLHENVKWVEGNNFTVWNSNGGPGRRPNKEYDHNQGYQQHQNQYVKHERPQQLPPSLNENVKWIQARNFSEWNNRRPHQGFQGKWMIFLPLEYIDEAWAVIEDATKRGQLGYMSSVRTCQSDPNPYFNQVDKVICVFTYDERDKPDIQRVRNQLRYMGFRDRLGYKTYQATSQQRYYHTGHRNLCKYRWY